MTNQSGNAVKSSSLHASLHGDFFFALNIVIKSGSEAYYGFIHTIFRLQKKEVLNIMIALHL